MQLLALMINSKNMQELDSRNNNFQSNQANPHPSAVVVSHNSDPVEHNSEPSDNSLPESQVLLVSNIPSVFQNSKELFNLFSCFGNLAIVLFMTNLRKALIEFKSVVSAKNCLEQMGKRKSIVLGLRVSYSKYKHIDINKSSKLQNSIMFNDIFVVPDSAQRFVLDDKPTVGINTCPVIKCESVCPQQIGVVAQFVLNVVRSLGVYFTSCGTHYD